jgi:hypothetical protein
MSRLYTSIPPATPEPKSPSTQPLRGRSLIVARATWIAVAVFAVSFFAAGIPFEFAFFRTVCQPACNTGQLPRLAYKPCTILASPSIFTPRTL